MRPGPPPKPEALKRLAGNPGKRRLNDAEPRPPKPGGVPYAPRSLCREGQREWRRIAGLLLEMGLYTEVDRAALAMYCQAFGRWVEAERQVDRTGGPVLTSSLGNLYQNPHVNAASRAWDQARKMLGEFGLTPASRSRLRIEKPEEEDELSVLFRRRVSVGSERE